MLYDETEVATRRKEYLEQLYGDETINETILENEEQIEDENRGEYVMREEFENAEEEESHRMKWKEKRYTAKNGEQLQNVKKSYSASLNCYTYDFKESS